MTKQERVIDEVKLRIRNREPLLSQIHIDDNTGTHYVGFSSNLDMRKLSGADVLELLTFGIKYPMNGEISITFAEYLLDRDVHTSYRLSEKLFDDMFNRINDDRQIVIIEIMFALGIKRFKKLKSFITAIRKEEWETAIYDFLSHSEARQFNDVANDYINKFKNT